MSRSNKGCIINFSTVAVPLALEGEAATQQVSQPLNL